MTRLLLVISLLLAVVAHAEITRTVTITGTDADLTDYQVKVPITWTNNMRQDFGDVRFYDTDGTTALTYWIEVETNGVSAIGWVKIPTLANSVERTIYMRYAQGQTTTTANGTNTFSFFDDFSSAGTTSFTLMGRSDYQRVYNAAFGCLLTDTSGQTVIDTSSNTWLYVSRSGGWAGEMNADTLVVGQTNLVKALDADSAWASPHLVIKVAEDFYIMAYSASVSGVGQSTRIATNDTPYGLFTRVSNIDIVGETGWELSGTSSWTESGIRYILDTESATSLSFWLGIENAGTHRMGWSRVTYDKTTGGFVESERYANNPLSTLLFTSFEWAYGGGNLDQTSLGLGDTKMMIYESRNGTQDYISIALSTNPFFDTITSKYHIDLPIHEETEVEKYQWYVRTNVLFLFYQLQSPDASKGTICRKYYPGELPSSKWTLEAGANARVANGKFVSAIMSSASPYTDTLSASTFGANKILRFKLQADTTNRIEQIGFRAGSSTGAGAVLQMNSEGYFRFFSHDGSASTGTNLSAIDFGWHTVELLRTATNATVTLDGTTSAVTANLSTSSLPILLAGYNGVPGAASKRDYVLVRDYVGAEPTVEVGPETGEPTTPTTPSANTGVLRGNTTKIRGNPHYWRLR